MRLILLLDKPDMKTPLGLRDGAFLQLLYATGLRVSELISLPLNNLNLEAGYLIAYGKGSKERLVPIGEVAQNCLKEYLEKGRPQLLGDNHSIYLFVSRRGKPLTRQGFWKLIKKYALSAGIQKNIISSHLKTLLCQPSFGRRS